MRKLFQMIFAETAPECGGAKMHITLFKMVEIFFLFEIGQRVYK